MRRIATVVLLLLLILLGAYSALWFVIAGRITDEIGQWAERERQRRFDVSWERLGVFGYPLAFRVTASEVRLRDLVPGRAAELRAPQVEATARPWNFRSWAIEVPGGLVRVAAHRAHQATGGRRGRARSRERCRGLARPREPDHRGRSF
jgi:hypothetical protein